eukprot:TRINITY_DN1665_c0_g1_i1.p1 TRINITY_DN1665_c0_g1~~TRINITY_DN1665_c0_g1_i1.p1  ORF type:complete len:465 (+),score=95.12 TRINITY_DN1665_c0_g1_i1:115-1509(+)
MDHWDGCWGDLVQRYDLIRETRFQKTSKDHCIEFVTVQRNVRLGRFHVGAVKNIMGNMSLKMQGLDPMACLHYPVGISSFFEWDGLQLRTETIKDAPLIITTNYFVIGIPPRVIGVLPTAKVVHRYDNRAEIRILPNIPYGTRFIEDAELPDHVAILRDNEIEFIDLDAFTKSWTHVENFSVSHISRGRAVIYLGYSVKIFDLFLGQTLCQLGKGDLAAHIQGNRAVAYSKSSVATYDLKTGRKLVEIPRRVSHAMIAMSMLILGTDAVEFFDADTGDMLLRIQFRFDGSHVTFPTNPKFQGNLFISSGTTVIQVDFTKFQVEMCVVVFPSGEMKEVEKRSVEMHEILGDTLPKRVTSCPIHIKPDVRLFVSFEQQGKPNPFMSRFHTPLVACEFPLEIITDGAPMPPPRAFQSQTRCFGHIDRDRPEDADNCGTLIFWKQEKLGDRWNAVNLAISELQFFKTR